jgi:hypothetical protein
VEVLKVGVEAMVAVANAIVGKAGGKAGGVAVGKAGAVANVVIDRAVVILVVAVVTATPKRIGTEQDCEEDTRLKESVETFANMGVFSLGIRVMPANADSV